VQPGVFTVGPVESSRYFVSAAAVIVNGFLRNFETSTTPQYGEQSDLWLMWISLFNSVDLEPSGFRCRNSSTYRVFSLLFQPIIPIC